jgi:hypothetical protein
VRKLTVIAATAGLALASLPTVAQPPVDPVRVEVYDGMVTFELPDGWNELPGEALEELTMWAAEATAGRSVEVYQHGFIPDEFASDPWLPHLLVQIRESGRISYARFLDLPPIDALRDSSKQQFPNGMPPLVMGVNVERASFDPEAFCVRLEHSLELRFKGPVRVQTAAFLTERGFIAIHDIDRKGRVDEARARFDTIVDSVSIAPSLAYRPRVLDRWPGLPYFTAAGFVAICLAAFLIRRRFST